MKIFIANRSYSGSIPSIDVTSSGRKPWNLLSPFKLGPVSLYGGMQSLNVENAWQYAKLYERFADEDGNPTPAYYKWAKQGWANPKAGRYPMGKGVKPLCSIWNGKKLDYITARKRIYLPLYAQGSLNSPVFAKLLELVEQLAKNDKDLVLLDFDAPKKPECPDNEGLLKKVNTPKTMGHAFALKMLIMAHFEDKNGTPLLCKELRNYLGFE